MEIVFFNNGMTACFNEAGEQVPMFQKSWLRMYLDFMAASGVDIEKLSVELPAGRARVIKFAVVDEGQPSWAWELV